MPRPESKKPNLKPKADLAGWLDKLGSESPGVKVVCQDEESVSAASGSGADLTGDEQDFSAKVRVEDITGTNIGGPEPEVNHAITGTDAGPPPGTDIGEDEIEPGQVLAGQYEIISLLGRGGMSAVYKAQDRLMRRVVAVKCLHAHLLSDKNSILRFQKEAQAAGNLNHPHIVKIHQYGFDHNKRPFLVMDYLEGQSLQELLDANKEIEVEDALRILVEAADGLEQAHKKGVVHRDFKPSNIMLVNTEEETNSVKIVDFGIAKVIAAPGEEGHNLTQTGEMLGSPNYMSPEQCMMFELDNRSDIYAFGCTMFAAFTGRAPFSSSSLVEIYYKHMNDLPESISVSRPTIKEAAQIDGVILKCMAKEPCDRYQTMAEARAAIQAIIDGGKQSLVDSLKDQLALSILKGKAKKTKKVSAIAVASAVGLIATVGLGAYFSGHFTRTDEQNWHDYFVKGQQSMDIGNYKDAESSLDKALASANSTGKVLNYVIPTMEELLDLSLIQGDLPKVQKYRSDIEALKKQHENSLPDLDKRLQFAMTQVDGGVVAKADQQSKEELEQLCQTINDQVGQLIGSGYITKALDMLQVADHLAQKALDPSAQVQTRTLHNMALCYSLQANETKAYGIYQRALELLKSKHSDADPALVKSLECMAHIDGMAGRTKDALSELSQARSITNIAYGPDSQQTAVVKLFLGEYYISQDKPKMALDEFRQALAIFQKDPATRPEEKARCLVGLACADESMASLNEALHAQEASPVKDRIPLIWIYQALGDQIKHHPAAMQLSKEAAKDRAAAYYKRAVALSYRTQPRDEARVAELYSRLNAYYFGKNEPLGLEPWYKQKIVVDQADYGAHAPIIVNDYLALASIYRQAGKLDPCGATLKQALDIAVKSETSGQNDPQAKEITNARVSQNLKDPLAVFKVKAAMAALYADLGKVDLALEVNKQALEIVDKLGAKEKVHVEVQAFFLRYTGLLDKLGKHDQSQDLKNSHKAYFPN